MRAGLVGFGLGFFVALQLGPMSMLLVLGVAIASLSWMSLLATGTAIASRAPGERAIRLADLLAGIGMLGFAGALGFATVHDRQA